MTRLCWILAVLLAACSASSTPPVPARVAGWRADIDALLAARDHVHPDGWHGMSRTDWVTAAGLVKAQVPKLTDEQALVELVRLAAMPGWSGRDGHSGVFPFIPGSGTHEYPLRFWQFTDGLFMTAAKAPYTGLVGSRVEALNGRPIADVLRLVEPLSPRDNPSNLMAYAPLYLRVSELLSGLGVLDRVGPATFRVVSRTGTRREVDVAPVTAEVDGAWNSGLPARLPPTSALWLHRQAMPLWFTYLPDRRTLFVQLNSVEASDQMASLALRARRPDVDRVVLDLRHNGGGDNTTLGPLEAVLTDPKVDRPGRLFVLVGRGTFSAAANLATDLEKDTTAVFAGEDMGGSPNLYGDAQRIDLPWGHQAVFMATRYWQRSSLGDPRVTLVPSIAAGLSSNDYAHGIDPVLDAVLAAAPPPA